MCVCIATTVDFSIQVQMNQWKIVWLPVWMNLMLLLEVVLSLVRVHMDILGHGYGAAVWFKSLSNKGRGLWHFLARYFMLG